MEIPVRAIGVLLLGLAATTAAAAEIYTWRDASGKVHFSDTPPADAKAQKMRPSSATSTDAPAAEASKPKSTAEKEREFKQRQEDAAKAKEKEAKDKAEAEEKRRNCEDARGQLNALESGRRMGRSTPEGEIIPLDDEARAQEIERTRKAVSGWCK